MARKAMLAPGPGRGFGLLADSTWILAANLVNFGARLIAHGEFERAEALVYESLRLFQEQGDNDVIGDCLGHLGRLALLRGDAVRARNLLNQAIQIQSFVPTNKYMWQVLLGIATLYCGDPPQARRLLNESLVHCLEWKNVVLLARICNLSGRNGALGR